MKPLAFLVLLSVLAVPAAAGSTEKPDPLKAGDTTALKERFKNQAPPAASPEDQFPASPEMSIDDLERLLLMDKNCKKNPDDTKDLAAELKGKYGIISCDSGETQILLVPKSVAVDQQLIFKSPPSAKLLRARFAGHYFVIQFDTQVQYLDMRKQTANGFELSGFVANQRATQFSEVPAFLDALKNHLGVAEGGPDAGAIAATRKAVADGAKASELEAWTLSNGRVLVFCKRAGSPVQVIWPDAKK